MAQLEQLILPVDDWYVPALQSTHASLLLFPYLPAAHAVHDEAPEALISPSAHVEHTPPEDLNLPAGHASHVTAPADAEMCPAAQLPQDALPVLLWYVPIGHKVHSVLPLPDANLPRAHDEQSPRPVYCWYLPAPQLVHD